jgi:hypothetical protein
MAWNDVEEAGAELVGIALQELVDVGPMGDDGTSAPVTWVTHPLPTNYDGQVFCHHLHSSLTVLHSQH